MTLIKVMKLDLSGAVTWAYTGTLLRRQPHRLKLEATFDIDSVPVANVVFRRGDRFVETYFDRRMYNVFKVFEGWTGPLKGWYCNISRPAVFEDGVVAWTDLALDLWVDVGGRQFVLDRDEFEALDLGRGERSQAVSALVELQRRFTKLLPAGNP